jgi:hypothetical protein
VPVIFLIDVEQSSLAWLPFARQISPLSCIIEPASSLISADFPAPLRPKQADARAENQIQFDLF